MVGIYTGPGAGNALRGLLAKANQSAQGGNQINQALSQLSGTFQGMQDRRLQEQARQERMAQVEKEAALRERDLRFRQDQAAQGQQQQHEQRVLQGQQRIGDIERKNAERTRSLAAGGALAELGGLKVPEGVEVTAGEVTPFIGAMARANKANAGAGAVDPGMAALWQSVYPDTPMPADMKSSVLLDYIERDDKLDKAKKEAAQDAVVITELRKRLPDLVPEGVNTLAGLKIAVEALGDADKAKLNEQIQQLEMEHAEAREKRAQTDEGRKDTRIDLAEDEAKRDAAMHKKRMDEPSAEAKLIYQSLGASMGPVIGMQLAQAMMTRMRELGPSASQGDIIKLFADMAKEVREQTE